MTKGLGWVQPACLLAIEQYDEDDMPGPTTYQVAAAIYEVQPDKDGNRFISDAQHVATKRALEGLQRKGHVIGFRAHRNRGDGGTELCHSWMSERRMTEWLANTRKAAAMALGNGNGTYFTAKADQLEAKARAIGMLAR